LLKSFDNEDGALVAGQFCREASIAHDRGRATPGVVHRQPCPCVRQEYIDCGSRIAAVDRDDRCVAGRVVMPREREQITVAGERFAPPTPERRLRERREVGLRSKAAVQTSEVVGPVTVIPPSPGSRPP
jgi:hypothetical protein